MTPHDPHSDHPGCCGGQGRWRRAGCHILGAIALGLLFALGFAWAVKLLWNGLMPQLFGLRLVTYWQAFGLLVLARLLFGGIHHGHGHRRRGRHGHRRRRGFCGCGSAPAEPPQEPGEPV
jgi:hypothetical protein